MTHGRVVRPPRYGARLESVDEAAARALPGVLAVVRDGSFLGVVAEREEQAIKARSALVGSAKWNGGTEMPDPDRLFDHLMALPTQTTIVGEKQTAGPAGTRTVEATYRQAVPGARIDRPVLRGRRLQGRQAHRVDALAGRVSAQARPRQGAEDGRGRGALHPRRRLGVLRPQRRRRRGARRGAAGARGAGRPVRLQWMRDDEFAWEPYGSAMLARAKASLSADGRIVDWHYEVFSNTHSTRPSAPGSDNNLLASWHLGEPSKPGPADQHSPARRRQRPQRRAALRFPQLADRQSSDHADAGAGVGAAHARRVRQRVRARILHGRAGGGGRHGSGRLSPRAT